MTGGDPEEVKEAFPPVHRVAALQESWLLGTHQGTVWRYHMDYYFDEFTFRFDRRTARSRGLLFYTLLHQAVNTAPAPEKSLIGGARGRRDAPLGTET